MSKFCCSASELSSCLMWVSTLLGTSSGASRFARRERLAAPVCRRTACVSMRLRSFGSVRSPSYWKVTFFLAASTSSSWAFRSFCAWPSCISMVCRFSGAVVSPRCATHTFFATTPKLFTVSLTPLSKSIKVFCEYPRVPLDVVAASPLVLTMLQLGTLDHLLGVPALDALSLLLAFKCICWSCSCFRCGWASRHWSPDKFRGNHSKKPKVAGRPLTVSARHRWCSRANAVGATRQRSADGPRLTLSAASSSAFDEQVLRHDALDARLEVQALLLSVLLHRHVVLHRTVPTTTYRDQHEWPVRPALGQNLAQVREQPLHLQLALVVLQVPLDALARIVLQVHGDLALAHVLSLRAPAVGLQLLRRQRWPGSPPCTTSSARLLSSHDKVLSPTTFGPSIVNNLSGQSTGNASVSDVLDVLSRSQALHTDLEHLPAPMLRSSLPGSSCPRCSFALHFSIPIFRSHSMTTRLGVLLDLLALFNSRLLLRWASRSQRLSRASCAFLRALRHEMTQAHGGSAKLYALPGALAPSSPPW
eukprot:CAMPEP_0203872658 /NCGR_PEP_ID=MMETSP0359-20131031/19352_1 /ASSEMBLY_ACC=CAM_ASM_000338 /TAXON_ID=268821 /ORGANISM="Scrippsiella Hangoei, Strain SHTV-5" /LENGTH=532 /DNA_ID=CAMNT_0050791347 /DNA_START=1131 /DNA_END=2727 /DNA_ORIENTATION=-